MKPELATIMPATLSRAARPDLGNCPACGKSKWKSAWKAGASEDSSWETEHAHRIACGECMGQA